MIRSEKFRVCITGNGMRYMYVHLICTYKINLTNPQRREHNTRSKARVCCVMRVSIKEQNNLLN